MSPTLSPNNDTTGDTDIVLVLRRTPFASIFADLRRGDVVTLTPPHSPDKESVKRIMALPGDTVLRDLRRVGKQAEEEGKMSTNIGMEPLPPAVRVPQGSVWIEGDAWRKSRDSNDFGAVSQSLINGRVWGVVWPLNRFGALARTEMSVRGRQSKSVKGPDSATMVVEAQPEPITLIL